MKITALKQQIKNPERVSIFVDEQYVFSLSLDELVKHKLKNGDELSETDVKKYKKLSADGKLRARSLEWLMNRPHSIRELRDYLYRKKAEPEFIDRLAEEFLAKKYLNDEVYARWLVDLKSRAGKSNRAIKAELFKKGIDRETVDLVMEAEAESEQDRLREVINKKKSLSRYKNDKLKFIKYLTSQGFSYQDVKQALKLENPED